MPNTRQKFLEFLHKPGRKTEVRGLAPTQNIKAKVLDKDDDWDGTGFVEPIKQRRLDRWLDHVVKFSGSSCAFLIIIAALLAWALLGIKFGQEEQWQVIISDVQAILCYIYDSLLTRQQLNVYDEDMAMIVQMQSRSESHLRMLRRLSNDLSLTERVDKKALVVAQQEVTTTELPKEKLLGRFATFASRALGHILTLFGFWIGVIIWLGLGPLVDFSDQWQLYMNSATSALMVFTFALLANVRERHGDHAKLCLDHLLKADSRLEARLRYLTADTQANPEVVVDAPQVGRIQRMIFYYADFVGTLVGIGILITVFIIWVGIGPVFQYSSNWWLLIGTYAGLIGMFDGFVLRNMQARLRSYIDIRMQIIHEHDKSLFDIVNQPLPGAETSEKPSITLRISQFVDRITSHEFAVVLNFLTIVGLVAGATAMQWTLTGQLLCNVPPSIIESWLMMVLLTGHNMIEEKKRAEIESLYERRVKLLSFIQAKYDNAQQAPASLKPPHQLGESEKTA